MKYTFIFLFFFFSFYQANAQEFSVYGSLQSAKDQTSIPGATILLAHPKDSSTVAGGGTDLNGKFRLENIKPGKYLLKVTFIGFQPLTRTIEVKQDQHLGVLSLKEETTRLEEVTVVGKRASGVQKGDTTQFNAGSFKTLADASGQDLVEKMPGIGMQDGNIQAQGENVVQILVDGKPFFGNDVKAALQNLPAEVIERVEVFDKKSDKAELSGFDDGEREKTINIVTKPNHRKGIFGKASAGYGSNERYLLGASVNLFNEARRLTITGLSNNINAVNYSADPNSQGESRTQNGIIKTNTIGLNFSDDWSEKIQISGSYLYSQRENFGRTSLIRDYVLPSDSGQVYTQESENNRKNMDHQFNMRFEYKPDSRNRILIRPNISLRNDRNNSYFLGNTVTESGPLNQTKNTLSARNADYDFNNRMLYSHRFKKKGRSLTLGLETGYHTNQDDTRRLAHNLYYREEEDETLNQHIVRNRTGLSWEANVSYTEPFGRHGQFEFEYEVDNRLNDSDKRTYNLYEEVEQDRVYSTLDTALSNTFKSDYLSQEFELGYQYAKNKFRLQAEAEYQQADLQNNQWFPRPFDMERTFRSILPTLRFAYKFSRSKNLNLDYDTRTNAPSIGQLQDVIDNSNPLHLRTGNPNLDQSFSNRIRLRYRSTNPETNQSFFVYAATRLIRNHIVNSTTISRETVELSDEVVLARGSQLTRPVNLDGYRDFRSYVSYGQPIDFIKSNIGLNGSVNYTRRPGMINDELNFVNSGHFRLGLSLSSNISDKMDFNLSTRSSYNVVENSLRPVLNNNYFNQSTRFSFDWIIWEGFVYRLDLNHQLNTGMAESFDNSFLLVNMSVGKKFLRDQQAEVSLHVYDLLGQNNNVRRNITELYVEDRQSNVLQRYFMLTLTYNLRYFNKGTSVEDYEELHH